MTHPDDVDASRALMMRLIDGDLDQMSLRKRITGAGDTLWVDLSVGVARRDDGQIDHFIAQMVDVTAEVEYADALETTVRRFRQLAENASDIVYEMGTDWIIRWISPVGAERAGLGSRPTHRCGRAHDHRAGPGESSRHPGSNRAGYRGGHNLAYLTASGQVRWLSAMAHPMTGDDDQVTGVIVGLRDVTTEIEAREALSRVQQRLRLAVDAAPNGLVITDEAEILVDVNHQFCQLIDVPEQEFCRSPDGPCPRQAQGGPCEAQSPHEHLLHRGDETMWIEHDVREVSGHADDEGVLRPPFRCHPGAGGAWELTHMATAHHTRSPAWRIAGGSSNASSGCLAPRPRRAPVWACCSATWTA